MAFEGILRAKKGWSTPE